MDSLLLVLNQTLQHRQVYDDQRWRRIGQLSAEFAAHRPASEAKFAVGLRLYEEYKAFQYDSAFACCQRLEQLTVQLHSPDKLASAKLKLTFILLSSGLFKEACDVLGALDPRPLVGDRRLEYQLMQVRAYSDLGEFSRNGFFQPRYVARALAYSDTVLHLGRPGSALQLELQEDLANRTNHLTADIAAYTRLRRQPNLSLHHLAIDAAMLAKLYRQASKALELLLVSTIADVQSATKETTSLSAVAAYCYQRGDVRFYKGGPRGGRLLQRPAAERAA